MSDTSINEEVLESSNATVKNGFKIALEMIYAPKETLKKIIERPRLLVAILIIMLAANFLFVARFSLYTEHIRTNLITAYDARGYEVSENQLNDITHISSLLGACIGPFVALGISALYTLLILGLFRLLNGKGKYKQYLAIMGYAQIALLMSAVASTFTSFFTGQLYFNTSITNFTNLMMPELKGSFIYGILRGIDVFTVWYYWLLYEGFSLLSGVDRKKAFAVVLIIAVITTFIGVNNYKML